MADANTQEPQLRRVTSWELLIGVCAVGLALTMLVAMIATRPVKLSWPPKDIPVRPYVDQIRAELATLKDHHWAGSYYWGDGTGANVWLWVAPRSGFAFVWEGCSGIYDQNHGDVTFENGLVELTPKLPNRVDGTLGIDTTFVPVAWGNRNYLIATNELDEFCDSIVGGWEPRLHINGQFLLRDGDWDKLVTEAPALPAEYALQEVRPAIAASIIAVGESRTRREPHKPYYKTTVVTLNVGEADGVSVDMEFHPVTDPLSAFVSVYSVAADKCYAMMRQSDEVEPANPHVGLKVATQSKCVRRK